MNPSRPPRLILASSSEIRLRLLKNAGLDPDVVPPRIDEDKIRRALEGKRTPPRDIADILAGTKAHHVSQLAPGAMVLGCDQVLEHDGTILAKPASPLDARAQLRALRGGTHRLLSAAVICLDSKPVWRHVGEVGLTMRDISDAYLDDYVERNWHSIRHAVGCYKLEEEGVRLFSRIDGDYFTVLGLPLISLLTWLAVRGDIAT
ncbi:MAG: nucleoside triphosphate pyrophosphatase [Paracoccaceae bacterium]